mmetsp:Transcript_27821/g.65589  ORF Transcript_27821/g.65589 Transcript_27821/m.65589 type:complete len:288 (-) Transcript_27821:1214-2077(-)
MKRIGDKFEFRDEGELTRLAQKYDITPTKRAKTPMITGSKLDEYEEHEKVDQKAYRSIIGAAMYAAVATRPDICYTLSRLASYSQDPRTIHYIAAVRLLQYLVNTKDKRITFKAASKPELKAYVDASWKTCKKTGKSYSGYFISLSNAPVVWKSNKQKVVAMSSGEAVYCDSQAAISIAAKPGFTQKGKNIRIEYHNVRDNYQTKQICINKIPGEDNPADILTKALPGPSNKKHCDFLFPISYREKLTIMLQGTRKRKITTKALPYKLPRLVGPTSAQTPYESPTSI